MFFFIAASLIPFTNGLLLIGNVNDKVSSESLAMKSEASGKNIIFFKSYAQLKYDN